VAVCDEESTPSLELAQADRVLYRPDGNRLRRRLCEALGLFRSKVIAAPLPGLMHVGEWRPEPAAPVPVCLAIALNADDLVRLILDANALHEKQLVLLTLTRTAWSPRSDSVIACSSITLIPVDDVIVAQEAMWVRSPAWDAFTAPLHGGVPSQAHACDSSGLSHEAASASPVKLGRPGEPCIVRGSTKMPLTDGQHAVIAALIEAGAEGLTKDALEAIRRSARRMLDDLRKDSDWAAVIRMAGRTNGRYRIRM